MIEVEAMVVKINKKLFISFIDRIPDLRGPNFREFVLANSLENFKIILIDNKTMAMLEKQGHLIEKRRFKINKLINKNMWKVRDLISL